MAALVLSAGGAALGGALFGPIGAMVGRLGGAIAGNMLDRSLFGNEPKNREGPRLADLNVMASTEGSPIPRVYGRARLSGQVIWATKLEEVVTTRSDSQGRGGKGFGAPQASTTTYTYFANFAVGLCEGEIADVGRVWADGQPLDLTNVNFRVHGGSEDQAADALIVAKEGAANAPAYRGLAYIVFERLPLEAFGNRLPQLSFEVIRSVGRLERMLRAVTLVPGTTEFGYEPKTVMRATGPGQSAPENRHVFTSPSDVSASLDELQALCPRLERIAIVVAWFGTDLRAGVCDIKPKVDNAAKETTGATWSVAGVTRAAASVVSMVDGRPAYGGTPSDESVRNLIKEIKARGLKVTLYPFVMMDVPKDNALPDPWTGGASQPAYPWRGRITCDPAPGQPGSPQGTPAAAAQVDAFFAGASTPKSWPDWRYRNFVLHYARLAAAAGGVDAFLIGSELKALTRVRSGNGVYPAVAQLVALAADVKAIVGSGTTVTYGADWTEYGADVVDADAKEVRFPLDPLWASPHIDAVGIDYYAPLADWRDEAGHLDSAIARTPYALDYLQGNVTGGEGYDWYYASAAARAAQQRSAITDGLGKPWTFRVKDLWNWWANAHHERVGGAELSAPTAWTPASKPIWITEVGCAAMDKAANQPSVFPDAKSSESNRPYFSSGSRDDLIQRRMLEAFIGVFEDPARNPLSPIDGRPMVDLSALHLWTWDARPYPAFPAAETIWSDGPNWQTGHWLTGRLGATPLDALIEAILRDCGITQIDTSSLQDFCEGYVVDRPMPPRAMIEPLASVYAFSAYADQSRLIFVPRGGLPVAEIGEDELVLSSRGGLARITRSQETELPRDVSLGFTDALKTYRRAAATSRRLVGGSNRTVNTDTAIVTHDSAAAQRAEIWLQDAWAGREHAEFALGRARLALMPGDSIGFTIGGRRHLMEILDIVDTEARAIKARSINPDVFNLPRPLPTLAVPDMPAAIGPAHVEVMHLPNLSGDDAAVLTRLAIAADPWPGGMTIWRASDGTSFTPAWAAAAPSIVGETLTPLPAGPSGRWDRANRFRVQLYGGALSSVSEARVFDGANAAAIRQGADSWEIIQFTTADLVAPRIYELSGLLRGQAGSEPAMAALLPAGARFVLLDTHLTPVASGIEALERNLLLRVAGSGRAHNDASAVTLNVTPKAVALTPLSPVHASARRTSAGVALSWIRRTRIDGDSWAAEPPLGEAAEAYALEILKGAAVARSFTTNIATALYDSADELADFGAPQSRLTIRVAQISAAVGAGHPLETTVTVLS